MDTCRNAPDTWTSTQKIFHTLHISSNCSRKITFLMSRRRMTLHLTSSSRQGHREELLLWMRCRLSPLTLCIFVSSKKNPINTKQSTKLCKRKLFLKLSQEYSSICCIIYNRLIIPLVPRGNSADTNEIEGCCTPPEYPVQNLLLHSPAGALGFIQPHVTTANHPASIIRGAEE